MSGSLSRLRLPLLLFALLALVGGSKLEALRPVEGQLVALAVPLVSVISGVSPFADAHSRLRNPVFTLGSLLLLLSEFGPYRVVIERAVAPPSIALSVGLVLCLPLAVWAEVAGAERGLRTRISAWFGLAVVFALYFPKHAEFQNLFGSAFAAFLIGLFVGGGGGLFLGEFAIRRARGGAR